MDRLLSVKDVAELLNMSSRTVYDHMRELGGFYPAGIRLLRFHTEVIYGVMEGQDKEGLAVQFSASGGNICRRRPEDATGSVGSPRRAEKRAKGKTQDDPNRHGLRGTG